MTLIIFLAAAVQAGTPLLFATLGEIITERSGHLNLGVEGLMLLGAVFGFYAGFVTGSPIIAMIAAALAGAVGALIYAFLTVSLRTNQVVTGLSLTIFGAGVSGFVGQGLVGQVLSESFRQTFGKMPIPVLSQIPVLGPIFFNHNIFVYFGYFMAILLTVYLYKTRAGLNLRAIGENPYAADASGLAITRTKYFHILLGGALCALGGAYLSLVYVPAWQEGVTAGRGWIAVALVIFSGWNPAFAFLGAVVFGGLDIVGFRLQKSDIVVSQYLIDMLPYAVTILVLILGSVRKKNKLHVPESLGEPYFREDRH
jgi:simple sugar transport system permease protein